MIQLHNDIGHQIRLIFQGDNLLEKALKTISIFKKITLEFQSIDVHFSKVDIYSGAPISSDEIEQPYFLLSDASLNADIELKVEMVEQQSIILKKLSPKSIIDFIQSEIERLKLLNSDKESEIDWNYLAFRAGSIQIPLEFTKNDSIELQFGSQIKYYPTKTVGDLATIVGPLRDSDIYPPFRVDFHKEADELTMDIYTRWSYWHNLEFEGAIQLRKLLSEFTNQGWENEYSEIFND